MAFADVTYTAGAAQTDFAIPFPFLQEAHVRLEIDGTPSSAFTLPDAVTLRLDTPAVGGEAVRVFRVTPNTVAGQLTTWPAGATITAAAMTTLQLQLLYIHQEAVDRLSVTEVAITEGAALPEVSAANNDWGLAVTAGAWDKRSPAQMRDHLGLGDAATADFGLDPGDILDAGSVGTAAFQNVGLDVDEVPTLVDVSGTPGLPAVDGSQLTGIIPGSLPAALISGSGQSSQDATGTWYQVNGTRLALSAETYFGNASDYVAAALGGIAPNNNMLTLQPGKYLILALLTLRNPNTGSHPFLEYRFTDGVDGGGTTILGTDYPPNPVTFALASASAHSQVTMFHRLSLDLASPGTVAFRMRNLGTTASTGLYRIDLLVIPAN